MNTMYSTARDDATSMMMFNPLAFTVQNNKCSNSNTGSDFMDRELEAWVGSRTAEQFPLTSQKMEPSFISQDNAFLEPYPLTKPKLLLDQQSRNNDLRAFLKYVLTGENLPASAPSAPMPQLNKPLPVPTEIKFPSMELPSLDRATFFEDLDNNSSDVVGNNDASDEHLPRFREYQDSQWNEQYRGLLAFLRKYGHCCVPNKCDDNPRLGRWVKRQRYQYKLLQQGKQSTLNASRVEALEEVGFVWDSHAALWVERLSELKEFRQIHGHCNVPSTYPENMQLSTWVKCQRRQYKLYTTPGSKMSNLNPERVAELEKLGFEWDGRLVRSNSRQFKR